MLLPPSPIGIARQRSRRDGLVARVVVAIALLAATLGCSDARAQSSRIDDTAQSEIRDALVASLRLQFELPADLPVAPALRAAASEMSAAHLLRMKSVIDRWIAEEIADGGAELYPSGLFRRVHARLLNEFALWHLVSVDRAHDAHMFSLALLPRACQPATQVGQFPLRVELLNRLPADQHSRALEVERQQLAAWGQPNRQVPPRPVPSVEEKLRAAVDELSSGIVKFDAAVPPGVADLLFISTPMPFEQMPEYAICLLRQWWVHAQLKSAGADRVRIDLARRYHDAPMVSSWFSDPPPTTRPNAAKTAPLEYPPFATRFGVEGKVEVEVVLGADGLVQDAVVVKRSITVPGIRDVPPVAFDLVFDEFSLARARKASFSKPDPALAKAGMARARIELVWVLK